MFAWRQSSLYAKALVTSIDGRVFEPDLKADGHQRTSEDVPKSVRTLTKHLLELLSLRRKSIALPARNPHMQGPGARSLEPQGLVSLKPMAASCTSSTSLCHHHFLSCDLVHHSS
jgi:hypothetical protein